MYLGYDGTYFTCSSEAVCCWQELYYKDRCKRPKLYLNLRKVSGEEVSELKRRLEGGEDGKKIKSSNHIRDIRTDPDRSS